MFVQKSSVTKLTSASRTRARRVPYIIYIKRPKIAFVWVPFYSLGVEPKRVRLNNLNGEISPILCHIKR